LTRRHILCYNRGMTTMLRCRCLRIATALMRSGVAPVAYLIVLVVHPLVHGTPLDGGALDGAIDTLRLWAFGPALPVEDD
jgi:hypothetical protein